MTFKVKLSEIRCQGLEEMPSAVAMALKAALPNVIFILHNEDLRSNSYQRKFL